MAAELVFYTPRSRGRIVRWMLEEVGASYRTELLEQETMEAQDHLAINPMGKLPTIVHGRTVVTEAAAICAYLADAFPDAGLAPRWISAAIIIVGCSLPLGLWKLRPQTDRSGSKSQTRVRGG